MATPHKHKDLIIAWASGAEIQLFQTSTGKWIDLPNPPEWGGSTYRIKPEEKKPVVRWLWADDEFQVCNYLMSEEENCTSFTTKLEWSRTEFSE